MPYQNQQKFLLSIFTYTIMVCLAIQLFVGVKSNPIQLFEEHNFMYLLFGPFGLQSAIYLLKSKNKVNDRKRKIILSVLLIIIFCTLSGLIDALISYNIWSAMGRPVSDFSLYVIPKITAGAIYGFVFSFITAIHLFFGKL